MDEEGGCCVDSADTALQQKVIPFPSHSAPQFVSSETGIGLRKLGCMETVVRTVNLPAQFKPAQFQ